MSPEFINSYIEQLNNAVSDLTKQSIVSNTQIKYYESLNAGLQERIQVLEAALAEKKSKKS